MSVIFCKTKKQTVYFKNFRLIKHILTENPKLLQFGTKYDYQITRSKFPSLVFCRLNTYI